MNQYRIHFFYDFELLIAPGLVLIVAVYRGPVVAVIVSMISTIPLVLFWDSFLPFIVLGLEAYFVGLFYNRIRNNLVLTVVIFWLILGAPIVWAYINYYEVVTESQKNIFILKRFINSILYSQVVALFIASKAFEKLLKGPGFSSVDSLNKKYTQQLSIIFVTAGMIVLLFNLNFKANKGFQDQQVKQDLVHASLKNKIDVLIQTRIASIKELAAIFSLVWNDPVLRKEQLVLASKRLPDFNAITLANNKAMVVDAYAPTLAIPDVIKQKFNIADRDYYAQAINADKPYVSKGFVNRGVEQYHVVAISSAIPNLKEGENVGTVQAAMFLNSFVTLKELFEKPIKCSFILLDQENKVLFSSKKLNLKDLESVNLSIAESVIHNQTVAQLVSSTGKLGSIIYYFRESKFDWGWKLITLEDEKILASYNEKILVYFVLIFIAIIVLSEIVAGFMSSFWTKQLRNLTSAVKYIGIEKKTKINMHDLLELPEELEVLYKAIEDSKREIDLLKYNNNQLIHAKSEQLEIAEEKLKLLDSRDSLTKLYNRKTFNTKLAQIWNERKKQHQSLSIIILNIDDFKEINAELGFKAGNSVLIQLSQCLLSYDNNLITCFARISGKEFGVICDSESHIDAVILAEQIQLAISSKKIILSEDNLFSMLDVTATVGVASIDPGRSNIEDIYKLLEKALQTAQKNGINSLHHINKSILT